MEKIFKKKPADCDVIVIGGKTPTTPLLSPINGYQSGQDNRRERRKRERQKSKK